MRTSSKYRRLVRQRKLRKQRSRALLILMALVIMIANVAFSKGSDEDKKIVVKSGDTLWSIAEEHKEKRTDLRSYVYKIAEYNDIEDCTIYCGQVLYLPEG